MFPGIRMLFVYSDDDLVAVSSAHASLSLSLNAPLSLSLCAPRPSEDTV